MLIQLKDLIQKYSIQFQGILHLGAHECEELQEYEKTLGRNDILWIEAMQNKVELCKQKYPNLRIENAVVSNTVEDVVFNISNNGQSSSILDFGLHQYFHPEVVFVNRIVCKTQRLDNILENYKDTKFNFFNLDIQGAELKALQGTGDYLKQVDYIYTEVNYDYVYKNCALVGEIDSFLKNYGFVRVETVWYKDCRWGDAFYIKSHLLKPVSFTTHDNGRRCNKLIRNLCANFIASKFDLYVNYADFNIMKNMGVELFVGNKTFDNQIIVNDNNFFSILNQDQIKSNINLNGDYFQTTEIISYIYKHILSIQDSIIQKNPYKHRYKNNNDCVIHIRLTDAEKFIFPYEVFNNMLSKIKYDNLFIATDNPNHIYIKRLLQTYKASNVLRMNPLETIQFASTCKSVVLSSGTFSSTIGYFSFFSDVYVSKLCKQNKWHGDIFSTPNFIEVE